MSGLQQSLAFVLIFLGAVGFSVATTAWIFKCADAQWSRARQMISLASGIVVLYGLFIGTVIVWGLKVVRQS